MAVSVSVIIPSFNRRHLLTRALNSVLAQETQPAEIIVVDDGSDDDTGAVVAEHYPQVKLLQQSNQGVSAARNTGARAATGEWLAFLDSDDEWLPTKLTLQSAAIQEYSELTLSHTEEIWIRNGRRMNQLKKHRKAGGWIYRNCLPLCVISPSSAVIRRRTFFELGGFDDDLPACEDYDLWLRVCARFPVHFISEPQIIKYGGHDDQLSQKHWGMDRFRIRALEKILESDVLDDVDRAATVDMLIEKLEIFVAGGEKRGRTDLGEYRDKISAYSSKRNLC